MTEKDLDIAIEKCERIMKFDTRTMQNPVSENGHIFEKVYELLKFLRQLQFATDTNVGGTNDTISRQAILDAVDGVTWYHQNKHGEMVHGANDDEHQAWYKAEDIYKAIEALPSAQPGCEDAVSRADVDILIEEAQTAWLMGDILLMYPALKKGLQKVSPVTPKQRGWIPVTERLPENEQEVFVTVEVRPIGCKPRRRVIKAFYTDGKHTDADSAYTWYEFEEPDFDNDGNIIVPEGWWEAVDYSDEFNMIDDFVVAWREPLEPWEEEKAEGAATP